MGVVVEPLDCFWVELIPANANDDNVDDVNPSWLVRRMQTISLFWLVINVVYEAAIKLTMSVHE